MRDFLNELEVGLRDLATHPAGLDRRSESRRSRRALNWLCSPIPRWTGSIAAVAAAVALGSAVTHQAHALPILDTPVADAQQPGVREALPRALAPLTNYEQGRAFETPNGTGYVVQTKSGTQTCIVLPVAGKPASFGSDCQATATVEEHGLAVVEVPPTSDGLATAALIVPAGEVEISVEQNRQSRPVDPRQGVAVAQATGRASLRWTVNGRVHTAAMAFPERDPDLVEFLCDDGTQQQFELKRGTVSAGEQLRTARRTLCP